MPGLRRIDHFRPPIVPGKKFNGSMVIKLPRVCPLVDLPAGAVTPRGCTREMEP